MSVLVLQWDMNPTTPSNVQHPFERLDPDCVLDAVDSVGLFGDGRLLALNSYENRVYQVGREEGEPVVVKFYRPNRWTDAAILEAASTPSGR
jgi:Ser/Thr protein kinase RdoA (MazF antagonist)